MIEEKQNEAPAMAVADLRRALVGYYGLLPPQPLQERFLVAAGEPLLAHNPCEDL